MGVYLARFTGQKHLSRIWAINVHAMPCSAMAYGYSLNYILLLHCMTSPWTMRSQMPAVLLCCWLFS